MAALAQAVRTPSRACRAAPCTLGTLAAHPGDMCHACVNVLNPGEVCYRFLPIIFVDTDAYISTRTRCGRNLQIPYD
jgi:hypothetical protein